MNLVCIGDSLTFGYGVDKHENWVSLINQQLSLSFLNKGLNGDTTAGMLFRFYEDVILPSPEYVFIMGGTNDFLLNYSIDNVIENIKQMIEDAKSNNIKVILGIQPPISPNLANKYWMPLNYDTVNSKLLAYKIWAREFCENNEIIYIDLHDAIKNELLKQNESNIYQDGIHLKPCGHQIIAKNVTKIILDNL